jgi:hypothetical protein
MSVLLKKVSQPRQFKDQTLVVYFTTKKQTSSSVRRVKKKGQPKVNTQFLHRNLNTQFKSVHFKSFIVLQILF